jgi:Zn-finger nucleic acid-binding protein
MSLTCPKCHGQMRSYERSNVTVDQCTECRGIFLDRGELERLVDAENTWHETTRAPQPPPPQHTPQTYPQRGYDPDYKRKRKKSFLDELFD